VVRAHQPNRRVNPSTSSPSWVTRGATPRAAGPPTRELSGRRCCSPASGGGGPRSRAQKGCSRKFLSSSSPPLVFPNLQLVRLLHWRSESQREARSGTFPPGSVSSSSHRALPHVGVGPPSMRVSRHLRSSAGARRSPSRLTCEHVARGRRLVRPVRGPVCGAG
jgi:hypothetical protein